MEKQSRKQNKAPILFTKDKDQQPMETHLHVISHGPRQAPLPSERASSASQFAITDFKQSICSSAIKTKKAKQSDTDKGRASLRKVCKKNHCLSIKNGEMTEKIQISFSSCVRDFQRNHKEL